MTTQTPQVQITKMLIIDRAGYGFSILWTADGQTWVNHRRNPINAAERDRSLEHLRLYASENMKERAITDFYGRIPCDWLVEGTRVV